MPAQIVALSGPLAGRSFALGNAPLTFGRSEENAVLIASPRASRRHAEIRFEGGAYLIYDLGSSNGTLLNGQPTRSAALRPGDSFTIGDESFRFEQTVAALGSTLLAPPPSASPVPPAPAPLPPVPTPAPRPLAAQQPLPPVAPADTYARPTRRNLIPLALAIGGLLACIIGAGMVGGVLFVRSLTGQPQAQSTGAPLRTALPVATLAPGAPTPEPEPTALAPAGGAEWTVLVYLDGDNNLESDALDDFREMASVGSSEQLQILVPLDRISSDESWDDTSSGNWEGTKRFRVERGMRPNADDALEDLGELNMGDPQTLADFIAWGVETAPARRYALIIWDHGAAWLGIASDDSSDGDTINLPELSSALDDARQRTGVQQLDLIGFDACLMAQMDVLQTIAPYAQVAVASAELEPNAGWAWDAWLGDLAANPGQSARETAPVIVDTYIDSYRGSDATEVTLSAFDLSSFATMTEQLDALSRALTADLRGSYNAIGQARSFADVYAPLYPEEFNAVDLGHFLSLLPEQGAPSAISDAAGSLGRSLEAARIANRFGSYHKNSSGISIYFPQLAELYVSAYELGSPLPRQTGWADFLQAYHQAGETSVERPTIGNLRLDRDTAAIDAPASLTGSVSGNDIAYVFAFIGTPNAARDSVELLYVDFIYPPGAAPDEETAPSWPSGSFDLSLDWDATSWYLDNGSEQVPVLLGPVKYGSGFFGVEGIYTSAATGQEIDAGLVFEVTNGQGRLVRIWGFPRGSGDQEPQPYELTPSSGDSFTAFVRTYTDTGASLEPGRERGATIAFTDQPLSTRFGSAPAGDYVMGFLVRDISGNFSYDYVDIATR